MTPAELAERNVGLVYAIARGQHRKLGGEYDELVGDGMVGLMQAALRFDAAVNDGPFSLYAQPRVAGAIVDGYRRRNRTGHNHSSGPRMVMVDCDGWTFRPHGHLERNANDHSAHNGAVRTENLMVSVPSPEDQVLDRMALGRLLEAVAELPEPLGAAMQVSIEGGSFTALAASEGVSKSRISQRLAEARRRVVA